jgi:NodT family efflux transporter outer membrane factor (OMF) lipoprotein
MGRMNFSVRSSKTKQKKRAIAIAIACSFLLVLPSCIPHLRPPMPGPNLPESFNGATSSENSAEVRIEEFFNDPMLTCLIHQALVGNQELRILNENIQIAGNEVLARRGAYLPFVTIGGGAGTTKYSNFTLEGAGIRDDPFLPGKFFPNPYPNFLIGFNLLWQVDIWRQLRDARDAAAQRFLGATNERDYLVTRLVAEIAENYYELMSLDKRLENLDNIIVLFQGSLEVARAKMQAARGNLLAVQRFQAEVRKNQAERLIVNQNIIQVGNRINFLAGRFPQPVERRSGESIDEFIDLNLHALSLGVPAQLLQNRPDIRQAERELAAAGLDVKVARKRFLPVLTVTGGVGYSAFNPRYLFLTPEALIGNVAGGLVGPLINFTAIKADYLTATARQLQSVYNYQRVIINAVTEVINRINKVENFRKSIEIKKQQVAALAASVVAATNLYMSPRAGVDIDYLDVLLAQDALFEARKELIETKQQQLSAIVNTYQALGGGAYLLPPLIPQSLQSHHKKHFLWSRHSQASEAAERGPGPLPTPEVVETGPEPPPAPAEGPSVPPPTPAAERGPEPPPTPAAETGLEPLPTPAAAERGPGGGKGSGTGSEGGGKGSGTGSNTDDPPR